MTKRREFIKKALPELQGLQLAGWGSVQGRTGPLWGPMKGLHLPLLVSADKEAGTSIHGAH
jgi:hypothetical protein